MVTRFLKWCATRKDSGILLFIIFYYPIPFLIVLATGGLSEIGAYVWMFVSLYLIPSYFYFVVNKYQIGAKKPFDGDDLQMIALEFFGVGIFFSLFTLFGAALLLGMPFLAIKWIILFIKNSG